MDRYKKHLKELTEEVILAVKTIDKILEQPPTKERGKAIAKAINRLELQNDIAMHYGLNHGFKKISDLKK